MDGNVFLSRIWALFYNMKNNLRRLMEPVLQHENITPMQTHILFEVSKGNINNISAICNELGINQGNASTMCKKLEQIDLLKRERSTEDERVVTLSLTPKGETILNNLNEQFKLFDEYCCTVSKEKMATIFKGFAQLEELMSEFTLFIENNNERN
jgi:Transcriptional regulators